MDLTGIRKYSLSIFLIVFGLVVILLPTYYKNSQNPDFVCVKASLNCERVKSDYRNIGIVLLLVGLTKLGFMFYSN